MKNIVKYSKGIRLTALVTIVLMCCEVLVETHLPKILSQIIDYVTAITDTGGSTTDGLHYIYKMGTLMVLLAVVGVTVHLIANYASQKASFGLSHNLRIASFEKIQVLGLKNIDRLTTTSLVVRLTNDISSVQNLFRQILGLGLRAPFMFLNSIIIAATLNKKLYLVFLYAIIPMLFTVVYRMNTALPVFKRVQKALDGLNDFVRENLLGIRVVKNYTKEEQQTEAFDEISSSYADITANANVKLAIIQPLMQLIMGFTTVGVIWYGGYLYLHDEVTIGVITALITYITQILMSFRMMSNIIVNYSRTKVSIDRINEIIDTEPAVAEKHNAIKELIDGSVEFKNVTFSYTDGGEDVLQDVSFVAKSGGVTAFLGGTGSGKSTLLHLIPRMYDVTGGEVIVGGTNVKDIALSTLRKDIAIVPQFSTLFSETVRSNLLWGNDNADEAQMKKALNTACADEFVEELTAGIDTFLARGGKNLSGGQKQRLCIARALIREPKILLLDDSLSAVDTKTDAAIRERLAQNYPDTTTIIIAQRIKSVKCADKIYVIDGGKIVAQGTHKTLSQTNEIYREIMDSQKEVVDE